MGRLESIQRNLQAALALVESCDGGGIGRDFDRALDGIASDIRNRLSEVESAVDQAEWRASQGEDEDEF